MSFREIRSFTEKMRVLGYPTVLSLDSFRTPNFPLVSDILYWICKRYDHNLDILYDISSEQDRVIFLKAVISFLTSKAHVLLNPKKLYMADGYAVKELLKVANLLHRATKPNQFKQDPVTNVDVNDQLATIKLVRSMASKLTEKGAELYQCLGKEENLRNARNQVISKPLDLKSLENDISESIIQLERQKQHMISTIENLSSDQTNLQVKISKKREELARAENRLKSLQGVRPAYMDEYEKQEIDLIRLYQDYMTRFRNLAFLEQQLDENAKIEMDAAMETDSTLKAMQDRIRQEELQLLRGPNAANFSQSSLDRPMRPNGAGHRPGSAFSDDESGQDSDQDISFDASEEEDGISKGDLDDDGSDDSLDDDENGF